MYMRVLHALNMIVDILYIDYKYRFNFIARRILIKYCFYDRNKNLDVSSETLSA